MKKPEKVKAMPCAATQEHGIFEFPIKKSNSKVTTKNPAVNKNQIAAGCKHFDECSAPLCPLDQESLNHGIWFPDESICINRQFSNRHFIQKQKRAKARAKDNDHYFTVAMLDRDIIISTGIKGIDPDLSTSESKTKEVQWINDHPAKKPLSDKRRAALHERGKALQEVKQKLKASRQGRTQKKTTQNNDDMGNKA